MKSKSKYLLSALVWACIAIVAAVQFFSFVNGHNPFPKLKSPSEMNVTLYEKTLSDSIQDIDIEWSTGGVTILPSEDNLVHIVERSNVQLPKRNWATIAQDGTTLNLKSRTQAIFIFFWNTPTSTLEMRLPESQYQALNLHLTSGSYSVRDINFSQLKAELASGDLRVKNSSINQLLLEMNSGQSNFSAMTIEDASIESNSGEFDFQGKITGSLKSDMTSGQQRYNLVEIVPDSLNLSMTSGSAEIQLPKNPGFTLDLDKTSGDFTADFEHTQSKNRYTYGLGTNVYQAEMTSGELIIRCAE